MTTSIKPSVAAYEAWLKNEIGAEFVDADLAVKHRKMRSGPFAFLRATYWRWAETILEICPGLADAPPILSIGDTHLENFGTWRDAEGRLIWGVNDFDEAAMMPYPLDLVRLAASVLLARDGSDPPASEICASLLGGYTAGLEDPIPFVLERDYQWLRTLVMLPEDERTRFWKKFTALDHAGAPPRFEAALREAMPAGGTGLAIAPRTAGTGSLGRPRFVARISWNGGPILREAKAIVVSGWSLHHHPADRTIRLGTIAAGRFRAPDPHYRYHDGLIVRRLSPNSRPIEVKKSAADLISPQMLEAMGREIATCHAGDGERAGAIRAELSQRPKNWLRKAAKAAALAISRDYQDYA